MTAVVVTGAVCGGLFGVAALSFKVLDGTFPLADIMLDGASGFLWLATGTLARIRRPANRVGLLMVAVGIGWFVEDLQLSRTVVVFNVGHLLTAASSGFLVHLVLAFPAGRLASRLPRLLAAAAYLPALAVVPFAALFSDRRALGLGHPPNLLLVRYDPQLVDTLWRTVQAVGVVVAAGVVAVLVRRWAGAQPPMRRVLAPVFVTGLAGSVASLVGSSLGPGHPLAGVALGVYKVAFVLLPLGFLAGVLRVRLGRTAVNTMLGELGRTQSPAGLRDLLARTPRRPVPAGRLLATRGSGFRRLERDLHDGAQQRLVTAAPGLRLAEQKLAADVDPQLRALLAGSADGLDAALAELRELARGIHPAVLTEAGLLAAVEALAARYPIPVELAAPGLPRLPESVERRPTSWSPRRSPTSRSTPMPARCGSRSRTALGNC